VAGPHRPHKAVTVIAALPVTDIGKPYKVPMRATAAVERPVKSLRVNHDIHQG
jgi:hypothetical protein